MEFNIHKKALLEEGRLVMDQDYRGYNISIASERGGRKAELCVFDKEGAIVSNQFSCFKGWMIMPSVENIRIIMNEIDKLEDGDKVGVKVKVGDPIPPNSNPLDYDRFQMASHAGNWMIMHEGSLSQTADVYHIPTGSKVHIDCSELKRYRGINKSTYPAAKRGYQETVCWVCEDCIPKDTENRFMSDGFIPQWLGKDYSGTRHYYDIKEDSMHGKGILSCDICGE